MEREADPVKDLLELVDHIKAQVPPNPRYFFTRATGVSDEHAVEFFKHISDVIVVTRKDKMYRRGEFIGYINIV